MRAWVMTITTAFTIVGCTGTGLIDGEVDRESIGTVEEVEACLVELDACRDAGVDSMACIDELLVCAEVTVDDLSSDSATCDAVHDLCLDRSYPGALCELVHGDCLAAGSAGWPSIEDCADVDELCAAMAGSTEEECRTLSALCSALSGEPAPEPEPEPIELCDDVHAQCESLGLEAELCQLAQNDCLASGGVDWPQAEDCPVALELCLASGADETLCLQIEEMCTAMATGEEPEPEAGVACEDIPELCDGAGIEAEHCLLLEERCWATDGAFPTTSDCDEVATLCPELGYSASECDMFTATCRSMVP